MLCCWGHRVSARVIWPSAGASRDRAGLPGIVHRHSSRHDCAPDTRLTENRLEDKLKLYTIPRLLIIDEIGYLPIDRTDQLATTHGVPQMIRTDKGKEFCGRAMLTWAHAHTVTLRLIEPGKPNQNAYSESFNGRFRDVMSV